MFPSDYMNQLASQQRQAYYDEMLRQQNRQLQQMGGMNGYGQLANQYQADEPQPNPVILLLEDV